MKPKITMKKHLNTIIIASSILLTAIIFSATYSNRNKRNNTISVTGLGKKDFVSDLIVWNGSFVKKNMNLKEA